MAKRTIFPRAPITEAVLDIRALLPAEINLESLRTFHDSVKENYPGKRERRIWKGGIEIKPEGHLEVLQSRGEPDGYQFISLDEKQIVQARLDGFTYNRLRPYDRWESFRDQAKSLWETYVTVARPERIIRTALRYINRIEIPLPMGDFKEYILTIPEVAPRLPQGLAKFFMQLFLTVDEIPATAIVTETLEPVSNFNKLPLIFDIDVVCETGFAVGSEEVWRLFEKLHDLKNDIFFDSITDRTKELFR